MMETDRHAFLAQIIHWHAYYYEGDPDDFDDDLADTILRALDQRANVVKVSGLVIEVRPTPELLAMIRNEIARAEGEEWKMEAADPCEESRTSYRCRGCGACLDIGVSKCPVCDPESRP
jgi:hypothetical protein